MNGSVKNKKSLALIMIITIVAAAVMGISISSCQKEETIKIAAVLSLTGPGQYSGVEVRDGMLLVVDEINSRGGINGKEIELIIEDHKTNPEEGKEAFDKIERTHHPVLYLSTQSSGYGFGSFGRRASSCSGLFIGDSAKDYRAQGMGFSILAHCGG